MTAEPLADLSRSFARDLKGAGKSERTIVLYCMSVDMFSRWLAERDRPQTTDSLTRPAIKAWVADLSDTKAPGTVRTRFRGMRRFVKWCVTEDILDASPMDNLEQPKAIDKPVPILTDDDIKALLKVTAGADFADRRDHAILRVLMDCGLRISEVAGLQVTDVDLKDHDVLHVIGKGSKPRSVPFCAKTGKALDQYLRARRGHRHAKSEALWLGERGPMSTDGISERLKVRGRQAGVEDLHAHRFRHTFAHDWLASGGQEQDLKRLAGWSSDAMLAVYARSTQVERAHDAHRRMMRGDRL